MVKQTGTTKASTRKMGTTNDSVKTGTMKNSIKTATTKTDTRKTDTRKMGTTNDSIKTSTMKTATMKNSTKVPAAKKAHSKKATTKSKKAAAKKRVAKKKVFVKAPEDKHFILLTGERLSHFIELADKLEHIQEDVFSHHVREEKNDFANWIQDVFNEPELAKQVASKKNSKDMQITIYKYIITKHLR